MESPLFYLKKAAVSGHTLLLRYLRRLAKELVIFTPLIILGLIAVNFWVPQTHFDNLKTTLSLNPTDAKSRLALAKILVANHNYSQAELELQKVPQTKESLNLLTTITLQNNSPKLIQEELNFWQQKHLEKPNFRDAFLKSAILNWKIYRTFEASKSLAKALILDPNNSFTKEVSKKLK